MQAIENGIQATALRRSLDVRLILEHNACR